MSSALAAHPLVTAIGWAIVHSLWQGAAIGLVTALALRLLAASTPHRRYVAACLGLAALAASWVITAAMQVDAASIGQAVHAATSSTAASTGVQAPPLPLTSIRDAGTLAAMPGPWHAALQSWSVAIVAAWLIGVCLLSVRLAFGWLQVQRVRKATQPVADALRARVHALAATLRIDHTVLVVQSAAVHVPTVVGWLRPMILLPVSALAGLSPSQLDAILAHELAHVRRHDYAINILQTAIEIVIFYHPACWWISRQIRHERELCCDDVAVAVCGDRVAYAAALTELEMLRGCAPALSLAVTGPERRREKADGPLLRRIRRLVAASPGTRRSAPSWVAIMLPLVVTAVVAIGAQSRTPTPARIIPINQGIVRGEIVEAGSSRPLRGVIVSVVGDPARMQVATGEDGRFEAAGLTPGAYRVTAKADGYLDAAYGGRPSGEVLWAEDSADTAALVEVPGGQVTGGIDLVMQRAAAISGRVLDSHGVGVAHAELSLLTDNQVRGRHLPVAFAQSDESGSFRFATLVPGNYYLETLRSRVDETAGTDRRAVLDELACRTTPETCREADRSTFYPGVPHVDEAQPIHVNGGDDLVGTDITLLSAATRRVAGRLFDPAHGVTANVEVTLHGDGRDYSTHTTTDGRFVFPGVAEGDYMLRANDLRWTTAIQSLSVDDEDVIDLEIRGRGTAHVDGEIRREANTAMPLDLHGIHVVLEQQTGNGGLQIHGPGTIPGAGTFSINVPSGITWIAVSEIPPGWMVHRMVVDGVDLATNRVDLAEGARRRIQVLLTDHITRLSGSVTDNRGRAVAGAWVLVFPKDRSLWNPASEAVQRFLADERGRYAVDRLAPGDYYVLATMTQAYPLDDPEVLTNLTRVAAEVHIGDGDQRVLPLRVLSPPPPPPPAPAPPAPAAPPQAPAPPAARTPIAPAPVAPSPGAAATPAAAPAGAAPAGASRAPQGLERQNRTLQQMQVELAKLEREIVARQQDLVRQQKDLEQQQRELAARAHELAIEAQKLQQEIQRDAPGAGGGR